MRPVGVKRDPRGPDLSIVIPAYNEVARIGHTVAAMQKYLDTCPETYELIVSADGNDGTRERARELAARDRRITVIGSERRGGKGRGIRNGVAVADGQVIGFVDADGKTPIEELDKVLPWLRRGYDIVIGSRALAESRIEVPQRLYRRVGAQVFGLWLRLLIGLWGIPDTQCGFKFFRGVVARDLFSRQRVDGYMFDVEVLFLAVQSGYLIRQIGVRWMDDDDSRLDLISGNWQNLLDVLKIRLRSVAARRVDDAGRRA